MRTKAMILIAALSVLTSIVVESCNSPAEKLENAENDVIEANQNLEDANEAYLEDIAAYREKTRLRIAANDSTINALKVNKKIEEQEEYDEELAELEQKNIDLEKKMDEYNGHGESKWEIFKNEFNKELEELEDAFDNLSKKKNK